MKIVILTGAGVSAESGLGTFRDEDGLWTKYDLSEVATPEGFARNPDLVHDFYNARRENCQQAVPNAAHAAIARLQASPAHEVTIVTQNIDDLHERAGAKDVLHMHGQILRGRCGACGHRWTVATPMATADPCPRCAAPATRPDVVWFGEVPYGLDDIGTCVAASDLFVAIGTSAEVYPAAGMVEMARGDTLELNLEPSARASSFARKRFGPATEIVPQWVDELLP